MGYIWELCGAYLVNIGTIIGVYMGMIWDDIGIV